MIIAHASDLHVGQDPENARRVRALARIWTYQHAHGQLDAVAITGDLTQDGHEHEWEALADALSACTAPLLLVPGNHDCGLLGITYQQDRADRAHAWCARISEHATRRVHGMAVWDWGALKILGLDSQAGQAGEALPPLARGEIGKRQLAALEVELQDPWPTIILLHHHPLWSEWAHVLEDGKDLLRILDRRHHVSHVLYGHKHHAAVKERNGVTFLASGKTTDLVDGRLVWRTIDLETGAVKNIIAERGVWESLM